MEVKKMEEGMGKREKVVEVERLTKKLCDGLSIGDNNKLDEEV